MTNLFGKDNFFIELQGNFESKMKIEETIQEISKKYNVNLFEYNTIKYGNFMSNDDTKYYAIDKTELLMLKTKVLENNYSKLLKRIEKLENLML